MRLRDKINLLIDLLLALLLASIAGIGLMIKYMLPPGREKILKFGGNVDLTFLGLDRHQWGAIHLLVAYAMLALVVLHILFHWQMVLCLVRKAIAPVWLRRSLWVTTGVLCFFLFLFTFFFTPVRQEAGDFMHRNARPGIGKNLSGKNERPGGVSQKNIPEIAVEDHGGPHDMAGRGFAGKLHKEESPETAARTRGGQQRQWSEGYDVLNGRMTLDQVAGRYGISTMEVRRRLGLPVDVPGTETLGRLRRVHGFTMQEARDRMGSPL